MKSSTLVRVALGSLLVIAASGVAKPALANSSRYTDATKNLTPKEKALLFNALRLGHPFGRDIARKFVHVRENDRLDIQLIALAAREQYRHETKDLDPNAREGTKMHYVAFLNSLMDYNIIVGGSLVSSAAVADGRAPTNELMNLVIATSGSTSPREAHDAMIRASKRSVSGFCKLAGSESSVFGKPIQNICKADSANK